MNTVRKQSLSVRLLAIIAAVLFAISAFGFLAVLVPPMQFSHAWQTNTFMDFQAVELGIQNPEFSGHTGAFPAAPTGWTTLDVPYTTAGATAKGVLDLNLYNTSEETIRNARLYEFPEFATAPPRTPFGTLVSVREDTNNILMVNTTRDTNTIVGFNSNTVTLEPNSFFSISAWIKTGEFFGANGASIRLNGITDYNAVFYNIQTTNASTVRTARNLFGWQQFTFLIQTSAIASESVSLTLSVGDYYKGLDRPGGDEILISRSASGYALFGNVRAYRISPTQFRTVSAGLNRNNPVSANGRMQLIDLSLPEIPLTNMSLNYMNGRPEGFTLTSSQGSQVSHIVRPIMINTNLPFDTRNNPYNLGESPISPLGRDSDTPYIAILSSLQRGRNETAQYRTISAGLVSLPLTISRMNFYRLSFWVNGNNVTGGAGITAEITTNVRDRENPYNRDNTPNYISFTAENLNGDSSNTARHGWTEIAFYIRGSFHQDFDITLGLWLGQPDAFSQGTAMFASLRLEELTPVQFSDNNVQSAGGSPVTIDGDALDTGVNNGHFTLFDLPSEGEIEFPLVPMHWEKNTPSTVNRIGFSTDETGIDTEEIVAGIMPTDPAHFAEHRHLYPAGVIAPQSSTNTVLLMASPVLNAFNFTSSSIGVSENSAMAITTSLRVDHIVGYGASLVLLDGQGIIATIENITNTGNRFQDFTFYVQTGTASQSLTLEIWLGLNERGSLNRNKLSSGIVYVDSVSTREVDPWEFAERFNSFRLALHSNVRNHSFAAVDYDSLLFTEFDAFDTGLVRHPYLWTLVTPSQATTTGVRAGIFDSARPNPYGAEIPTRFRNAQSRDQSGNLWRNNVVMLDHAIPTASRFTLNRNFILDPDSYYRLDISIKVDIQRYIMGTNYRPGDALVRNGIGAGIELVGTDHGFTNISSQYVTFPAVSTATQTLVEQTVLIMDTAHRAGRFFDNSAFLTYSFYLKIGEIIPGIQLAFTLGGERISEFTRGTLYINAIELESITNVDFEERARSIHRDTTNVMAIDFSEDADWDTDPNLPGTELPDQVEPGFDWLIVPAIVFGAALLIAIAAYAVRKAHDSISAKRAKRVRAGGTVGSGKSKLASYDRKAPQKGYSTFVEEEEEVKTLTDTDEKLGYEEFDEEELDIPKKGAKVTKSPVKKVVITDALKVTTADKGDTTDGESAESVVVDAADGEAMEEEITTEVIRKVSPAPKADTFIDDFDD